MECPRRGRKAAVVPVNAPMEDNAMVSGTAVVVVVVFVLLEALDVILDGGGNDAYIGNIDDG